MTLKRMKSDRVYLSLAIRVKWTACLAFVLCSLISVVIVPKTHAATPGITSNTAEVNG